MVATAMPEGWPELHSGRVPALVPGYRLGDHEIVRCIGRGGFGIVYLARAIPGGAPLAIKEFAPDATAQRDPAGTLHSRGKAVAAQFEQGLQAFSAEARLLATLEHPALPRPLRYWRQNGTAYYSLPHYAGPTLQQLAERSERLDQRWLDEPLGRLLGGLEEIHRGGHCHHDIAPDNIILDADGSPVLLDPGAAIGKASGGDLRLIKPGYTSLEQYCRHEQDYGPWSDLYSLAAVLYRLITGNLPPASLARSVRDDLLPLAEQELPGYARHTLAAIDRALRLPCRERPQTVAQFAAELGLQRVGRVYRRAQR
jgi:non-specific serine/threonine protein kinase